MLNVSTEVVAVERILYPINPSNTVRSEINTLISENFQTIDILIRSFREKSREIRNHVEENKKRKKKKRKRGETVDRKERRK